MPSRPLRRSSPVQLAVLGVVGLAVGRGLRPFVEWRGEPAPTVSWVAAGTMLFLAGALAFLAWTTFQSLHRERRTMHPTRALRLLALAKASAIVTALIAGYYVGFALSFAGDMELALPRERVVHSAAAAVAALLALAAALTLERACEVPKDDDDEDAPAQA
ncbi:DUF3180 domain-containing protein [Mumia sp. zg.B53]|uniref:DUF3180 domain-containing protein n=1 Tax=unclassified Mumia TaxID=2621872 RepID=UPI001C6E1696|nr:MULTISPECIES: DUF3180 domain-containing protein [unclassified Mumia]MBW9204475.1 DUF3180 domain-containing protein [Mumia sp. zg.B17]MBW9214143.1 DUF3180 domain-containing protein [Mumia sp. zg.B53]